MKNKLTRNLSGIILLSSLATGLYAQANVTASISESSRTASMSNGIVSLTINSKGQVNSLKLEGKELLESAKGGRFYFSYNDQDAYSELNPTAIRIEKQSDDYAEVVYTNSTGTLLIEQAFILVKGVSGVYSYVILKGTKTDITLREMRVVYRVSPTLFDYGYVSDAMQGYLPSVETMIAVNDLSVMDATYPLPDGSIYTKYNWANYIVADSVHGIMSTDQGLWAINPSNEYINGGPMRQELTVHATNKTPLVLQMLQGEHFGALAPTYTEGVEKIYGPFFIYVNSGNSHEEMIEDAKQQATVQRLQWPYQWLDNELYPLQRTVLKGNFNVPGYMSREGLQVVLAQLGSDIYDQGLDYIFWTKTDSSGNFNLPHVRPANYTLYVYATGGEITDIFKANLKVSGDETDLHTLTWTPVKYEHLLFQIGESDRLSKGFRYSDTLRQYGLYDLPPDNLTYTYGSSDPATDWYYAQTKSGEWTVSFTCDSVYEGDATLTVGIAGATSNPSVDVYVNGVKKTTWSFGNDAAVYRSAVQGGEYQLKELSFPASDLAVGANTVQFKLTSVGSRGGLMYDYIKLEAGEKITNPRYTGLPGITLARSIECYPNPFTDQIVFKLQGYAANDNINLSVYNIQGRLLDVVFDGYLNRESREISWGNRELPDGQYIYRLKAGDSIRTGKIQKIH